MKTFIAESGQYTPKVILNPDEKKFYFSGNSFPVNPQAFYQPIIQWFSTFLMSSYLKDEIVINFDLNYINTASSKQIACLFWLFETSPDKDKIIINWYYDESDNDMLEVGERYKHYLDLRFRFTDKTVEQSAQILM